MIHTIYIRSRRIQAWLINNLSITLTFVASSVAKQKKIMKPKKPVQHKGVASQTTGGSFVGNEYHNNGQVGLGENKHIGIGQDNNRGLVGNEAIEGVAS